MSTSTRTPTTDTPLARYDLATGPDGWLTVDGWERLADDLEAELERLHRAHLRAAARPDSGRVDSEAWVRRRAAEAEFGAATKLRDRAADCRSRAARMRAGVVVR